MIDEDTLATLRQNAERLAWAGLQAAAEPLMPPPDAAPAAPLQDAEVLALLDPARLDLAALDAAFAGDGDDTPDDEPVDLEAALAALPAGLPPLTATLDDAGFGAWLALYTGGDDALHRLVAALMRQD